MTYFIGLGLSAILFSLIVFLGHTSFGSYLNQEGVIIVIGGTVSIFLMSNKKSTLEAFVHLLKSFLGLGTKFNYEDVQKDLMKCSRSLNEGRVPKSEYVFVNQAVEWISAGLSKDELYGVLENSIQTQLNIRFKAAEAIRKLGKYPPALGMIGTVFGIIGIFQNLGNESGAAEIGLNLGVAMTATLYGLVLANIFISPLSEAITEKALEEEEILRMIQDTVIQWDRGDSLFLIKENLSLYNEAS